MLENAGSSGVSRQPDGKLELTFHAAIVGKLAVPGGLALSTWLGDRIGVSWGAPGSPSEVRVEYVYRYMCVYIQIYYVYVLYRYFFSIFAVSLPKRMENLVILAPEQVAFEVRIWSLSIFWENWVSFHKLGPQLKVIVPKAPWNVHSFKDKSSEWLRKSLLIPRVTLMAHAVPVKIQALTYAKLKGSFSFCFGPIDCIAINRQRSLQPLLCLLTM